MRRGGWKDGVMSDTELRALTALGFDELRQATGGLGAIHRAVAGRVFRAVGPGAALVRPMHEAVTRGVYAGIGHGTRAVAWRRRPRSRGGKRRCSPRRREEAL
jgi:hypothetical protein